MPLIRLIYASEVTNKLDFEGLTEILKVARKNNRKADVTGVLCYDPKYFMQWLEGPRDSVNRLYTVIVGDPRHTGITILDYQEISRRNFEKWSMAYVSTRKADQSILFKYSTSPHFDPFGMSAESAAGFLAELTAQKDEILGQTVNDEDFLEYPLKREKD